MSEPEFEMYLSLMSKFLRLTSTQKADIAEELRIHLEDRLAELTAQGKSREEAIRLALDEFGDAGALAWQFTLPHHIRRRRLIMRYSVGSFVAVAGIFALVSLMWPHRPDHPPMLAQAVAQADPDKQVANTFTAAEPSEKSELHKQIEAKLEKLIDQEIKISQGADGQIGSAIDFLKNSLQEIQEVIDVDILIDQLNDSPENAKFVVSARAGSLTGRTVLELVLRQTGMPSLTYVIKDGVILITDSDADYEVQVYDCRDLLANMTFPQAVGGMGGGMMGGMGGGGMGGMGGGMGGGGGTFSVPAELLPAVIGQFGGGMGGGAQPQNDEENQDEGEQPQNQPARRGMGGVRPAPGGIGSLMMVIQHATKPAQWEAFDGNGGTMSAFDGMLVVRHNQAVHRKIEEVLEKLRVAKRAHGNAAKQERAAAAPLVIPPGKRLVTVNANNWQVPANALKVGSHVDVITTENPNSTTPVIISDLEVAVINGAGMGFNITFVHNLGFLVTPEQAMELKAAENNRPLQFLLRGDEEFGPIKPKIKSEKNAPQETGSELVIPAGKRLVTMIPSNWQLPANAMKVGSRVDMYEMTSGPEGYKPELAFSNLEVAAFSARRVDRDSPAVGESSENVWINTISFVVEPQLAEKLKEFQVRTSYSSVNGGAVQFVLRSEQDVTKPLPVLDGAASLQSALQNFSSAVFSDPPSTDTVLASLPERRRKNAQIIVEPVALRLDQARFYPLVGPAQLIHCHYKCIVRYDLDQSAPDRPGEAAATEVVFVDQAKLVRADGRDWPQ